MGPLQGGGQEKRRSHSRHDASVASEGSAEFLLGKEEGRTFKEEGRAITKA